MREEIKFSQNVCQIVMQVLEQFGKALELFCLTCGFAGTIKQFGISTMNIQPVWYTY